MSCNRLRLVAVILLALLAVPSWAAPQAHPAPTLNPRAEMELPSLFARVWTAVAQLWHKNGISADPFGLCASCDEPTLDPYGLCGVCNGATASGSGS